MNFCPNCGEKLVGKKKFCANCGFDLQDLGDRSVPNFKNPSIASPDLDNKEEVINNASLSPLNQDEYSNDSTDNSDKFEEEYILPEIFNCPHCTIKLELEDQERSEGKFTCPKCNSDIKESPSSEVSDKFDNIGTDSSRKTYLNQINKDNPLKFSSETKQGLVEVANEISKEPTPDLILPENFNCPKCGIELVLETNERINRKFTCPNCSSDVSVSALSKDLVPWDVKSNPTSSIKNNNSSSNEEVLLKDQKELPFEDKAWIFFGSMVSMGIVGFGMFIKYRLDGFKKKSNQACMVSILGFAALFLIVIIKEFIKAGSR